MVKVGRLASAAVAGDLLSGPIKTLPTSLALLKGLTQFGQARGQWWGMMRSKKAKRLQTVAVYRSLTIINCRVDLRRASSTPR